MVSAILAEKPCACDLPAEEEAFTPEANDAAHSDGLSDVGNPYLFTGRRLDPETGLMQYRHRYYSPALGRFASRDRTEYSDGYDLYCWVNGRPTLRGDPLGLAAVVAYSWTFEAMGGLVVGGGRYERNTFVPKKWPAPGYIGGEGRAGATVGCRMQGPIAAGKCDRDAPIAAYATIGPLLRKTRIKGSSHFTGQVYPASDGTFKCCRCVNIVQVVDTWERWKDGSEAKWPWHPEPDVPYPWVEPNTWTDDPGRDFSVYPDSEIAELLQFFESNLLCFDSENCGKPLGWIDWGHYAAQVGGGKAIAARGFGKEPDHWIAGLKAVAKYDGPLYEGGSPDLGVAETRVREHCRKLGSKYYKD